jgi:hypothetical protein
MRYLKKYNESLDNDIKELIYDIEDILIEVDDLNIKEDYDYEHNLESLKISGVDYIVVTILKKRIATSSCRKFNKSSDFFELSKIKPIFDRIVRTYGSESIISIRYTSDTGQYQSVKGEYNKMFNKSKWFGDSIDNHYRIEGYEISGLILYLEI